MVLSRVPGITGRFFKKSLVVLQEFQAVLELVPLVVEALIDL